MLDQWRAWIGAFDRACETDRWDELHDYLADDVTYIVAGVPFACELRGRDAVIAGFQRSVRNFDRKFDARRWDGVGVRALAPNAVTARAFGTYELAGKPTLTFAAHGAWFFRGETICLMTDIYDAAEADIVAAFGWLEAHGAGMDPGYA